VGERVPLPSWREVLTPQRDSVDGPPASLGVSRRFDNLCCHGYDSATAALAAALRAARSSRDLARPEVIVPAFACPDIVAAAMFAGVTPVLADFLPGCTELDGRDVAAALTPNTIAVVSVRLLGLPSNVDALRDAIRGSGALLIEDCAHVWPTEAVASRADAAILSFGRGKPISLRRGGILLVARAARSLACMPEPLAPYMPRLPSRVAHWAISALYNAAISPSLYGALTRAGRISVDTIRLRPLEQIRGFPAHLLPVLGRSADPQRDPERAQCALAALVRRTAGPWLDLADAVSRRNGEDFALRMPRLWRYPLLLESEASRDRLFRKLWGAGLGASRLYRRTLGELPSTAPHVRARRHPVAQAFARRLLTLPIHSDVQTTDLEKIESTLRAFAKEEAGSRAPCIRSAPVVRAQ
jgi:hypothetical protein